MSDLSELAPAEMDWFLNARFGMFIHWGAYSVAARHEWVKNRECITDEAYQKYVDHFDPDLYNPEAWAREALNAGMKYAVITTKHHDGFCLWDSALTDYKATNTPAKRDLLTPWTTAFRDAGLKVGFYHSLLDWHHPEFPIDGHHPMRNDEAYRAANANRDVRKYAEYLHGQTRELMTQFGKLDILWFDFSYSDRDWGWSKGKGKDDWGSVELLKMVRTLQPGIILNDRLELGGDVTTPEEYQPREWMQVNGKRVVWEACQTFNGSWGYDRDNQNWRPSTMLVQMLIDTVSKGGNLLLNVGPNARGEFDANSLKRLREIGEWMRLHGSSIYGCSESAFQAPADCRYTQNGKRLYLHVFNWPFRHLHLDGLAGKVEFARLLNDGSEIQMLDLDPHKQATTVHLAGKEGAVTLELPVQKPDVLSPVIELFLK